ncbi:MAG: amino acid ABC transporter permease [Mycobacteriales bacterium]
MSTTGAAARRHLSPRKRVRRIRFVQYAVLVLVVVLAATLANWKQIGDVFFRPSMIRTTLSQGVGHALLNTVIYTAGAFVFGLVVGTVLALMRLSEVLPYRWLATAYIEFFRGLPAIVVFLVFSLLPLAFTNFSIPFDPYGTVWLALGMVGSAYIAETIRAGILGVPRGQTEAARSLGMPPGLAMRKVVLPQAFRIVLPPLTNELILMIKDSSLVYIVGVASNQYELTKFGRELSNSNANVTPLVVAGFFYLLITLPLTVVVRRMERAAARSR